MVKDLLLLLHEATAELIVTSRGVTVPTWCMLGSPQYKLSFITIFGFRALCLKSGFLRAVRFALANDGLRVASTHAT